MVTSLAQESTDGTVFVKRNEMAAEVKVPEAWIVK